MNKTSRRNFAKTTPDKRAQVGSSVESILSHQNTPPPLEILDGSLIVESSEEFTETSPGRFLYKSRTATMIDHIKVVSDSGEKLYEDLYANDGTTSSSIEIVWGNEDKNATGNVIITGGTVFQIDSDKKLDKSAQKKRRKFKYDHKGPGGGKRIRIESIEITNALGRKTKFTATPTGTADNFIPDEFRILVWYD